MESSSDGASYAVPEPSWLKQEQVRRMSTIPWQMPMPARVGWLATSYALALITALTLLTGCASGLITAQKQPSFTIAEPGATALGTVATRTLQGSASEDSALHLLPGGLESLAARVALIERAQRGVDVQYYIWRADASGELLATALWHAAERGVRVRILLDDWGTRPTERELGMLAAHPNIEVRLFNPLPVRGAPVLGILADFERGNRRMHNKALIADNQAAIVGGRNVGDEYFGSHRDFAFGDLDVLAVGPVVRQVSAGFDTFWNSEATARVVAAEVAASSPGNPGVVELRKAVAESDFAARLELGELPFYRGRAIALHDFPDKADPAADGGGRAHLGRQIAEVIGSPAFELLLVSAYFVPGAGGVEQLAAFREKGIRVVIVTNSLAATDVPAVHAGYARYRRPLLESGVELFEIRPEGDEKMALRDSGLPGSSRVSLHAKLLVVDRQTTFIGSMNIDPRSIVLNTENGIVFSNAAMAESIVAGTEQAIKTSAYRLERVDGKLRWRASAADGEKVFASEPGAGFWQRTWIRLISWFDLEALL
jgi:putative cardiolipin synthase